MPEWRQIPGYPDFAVSDDGKVKDLRTEQEVRTHLASRYYRAVSLESRFGGRPRIRVHHIVAWVFHGPKPHLRAHVRHLDGDPQNNAAGNLRWGTAKENGQDRVTHGTTVRGEDHYASRFTDDDVTEMKRLVAAGKKPKEVAEAFGTTDRLIYGLISGGKRPHHICDYDEAARAAIRKRISPEQEAEVRRLRAEGYPLREIGRRIGRTHQAVRHILNRPDSGQHEDCSTAAAGIPGTANDAPVLTSFLPADYYTRNWRPMQDWGYLVADNSAVWDLSRGEIVPAQPMKGGYPEVILYDPMGEPARHRLHRLVATLFLDPPKAGAYLVRHRDNNPENNHVKNLEWGTGAENAADRIRAGTTTRGERSRSAKLTEAKVKAMREERAQRGTPMAQLASKFEVSLANVSLIIARKTWVHVATASEMPRRSSRHADDRQGQLPL